MATRFSEISSGNPFAGLNSLRREMDRLFSDYFAPQPGLFGGGVFPQVNIYQDGENFYVTAELPGVEPEGVDISIQGANLFLKGERKSETGGERKYHRRERTYGAFNRVIALPQKVDTGKVTAAYKDGVLTLTLPLSEETKPKQIEVKAA